MAGLCKTCSGNYRGSHCNDCKNNAYEINGICELKREAGSSCAESYQCTSAKCPRSQSAGHCCASNVVTQAGSPHQCLACDARGACTSCAQHHLWSGALCKTKVPQPGGAVCEVDSDCSSGQCGHSAPGELGHCCSRRINHCSYCGKNGECKQCVQGWTFDFGAQKCMSDSSVAAPVPHSVKHGHWGKPHSGPSPHVTGTELRVAVTASSVLERKNDQLRSGRGWHVSSSMQVAQRMHDLMVGGKRTRTRFERESVAPGETCQSQDQVQECVGAGALADWKAIAAAWWRRDIYSSHAVPLGRPGASQECGSTTSAIPLQHPRVRL